MNGLKFSTSVGLPLSPWMVSVPPAAEPAEADEPPPDEQAAVPAATKATATAASADLSGGCRVIVLLLMGAEGQALPKVLVQRRQPDPGDAGHRQPETEARGAALGCDVRQPLLMQLVAGPQPGPEPLVRP